MSYTKHADNILLSATPDDTLETFRLDSGTPVLGVCIFYTANVASSTGYPGFRLYWTVPQVGEVLATVRNTTPAISAGEASLSEYDGIVLCKDLTDSDGTVGRARTYDIHPGATHVRLEPYEAGDTVNPGHTTIWLGRA